MLEENLQNLEINEASVGSLDSYIEERALPESKITKGTTKIGDSNMPPEMANDKRLYYSCFRRLTRAQRKSDMKNKVFDFKDEGVMEENIS